MDNFCYPSCDLYRLPKTEYILYYGPIPMYARSGSDWDASYCDDLRFGFRDISNFKDFFGQERPLVSNGVLDYDFTGDLDKIIETAPTGIANLAKYISMVCGIHMNMESAVDEMFREFLRLVGIADIRKFAVLGPFILSMISMGSKINANPDIVISDLNSRIILLVVEDKSFTVASGRTSAEYQLLSEAILAAHSNFELDIENRETIIYGITMLGTLPTFYKFRITKDIVRRVVYGPSENDSFVRFERFRLSQRIPYSNFLIDKRENMNTFLECLEVIKLKLLTL